MVPALVTSASREKSRNRFQFLGRLSGLRNSSAVTDRRHRTKLRRSTTSNQPINKQKQHRANYRSDKTGWLTRLVPPNYLPQKSGHKRAGNTEQNGNKATTRIRAWHKKLCNRADNQPDNQCAKNRCQHNCLFYRFICVLASAPLRLSYGSSISCAERISSLSRILFSNLSSGALSRFSTVSAVPPAWFRLSDIVAMFTPCCPSKVPIRPTMPGRSVFSSTRITPCGRASTGRALMLTIRGVIPKNAPPTEISFPSALAESSSMSE